MQNILLTAKGVLKLGKVTPKDDLSQAMELTTVKPTLEWPERTAIDHSLLESLRFGTEHLSCYSGRSSIRLLSICGLRDLY